MRSPELLDPIARTLEVFALEADGHWKLLTVQREASRVRAAPFEAMKLDLSLLWAEQEEEGEVSSGEKSVAQAASTGHAAKPKRTARRAPSAKPSGKQRPKR